jgi:hypothetical protein
MGVSAEQFHSRRRPGQLLPGGGLPWSRLARPRSEFARADFARAERGEVRGGHLAIDHAESVRSRAAREVGEGDLRGVGLDAREHRLAVEGAADRHAVETAGEAPSIQVSTRVRVAEFVQAEVGRCIAGVIQVPSWPGARCGAGAHHLGEGRVERALRSPRRSVLRSER